MLVVGVALLEVAHSGLRRRLFAGAARAEQQGLKPLVLAPEAIPAALPRAGVLGKLSVAMPEATTRPGATTGAAKPRFLLLRESRVRGGWLVDIDWSVCVAG